MQTSRSKYRRKARLLIKSGFQVFAVGNFDLSLEQLAQVLMFLDINDERTLREIYSETVEENL